MNKILGLGFLAIINGSVYYLIYWYIYVVCSTKLENILNISYEPSGMQLYFYFLSLPLFLLLAALSVLHRSYYNLKKSLSLGIFLIWFCYFILSLYVDLVVPFTKSNLLYYGTLSISLVAIGYVSYITFCQVWSYLDD